MPSSPPGQLVSHRIFAQLESEILSRTRPPGSRLVEDALAAELGVSRTPVREALQMLYHAGWLELQPHAGANVRQPSIDEVRDVFDLRELLEPAAAAGAAEHASDEDRAMLRRLVDRGMELAGQGDSIALVELNSEFHQGIAQATRRRLLNRFVEELDKQARWLFAAVVTQRAADSWQEHAAILEAIELRDGRSAQRLSRDHVRRTRRAFVDVFLQTR